ncbi:hypothetical protein AM587_10010145 [Phytophthora nicotianae]|uniref:Uncharacterized protein n=1 Tax=Phytophthora nicotianae TaxID=4792 RepID=A0A0W8CQ22_PHYNI|nr:hypothetical protein AM587_10010145 [Phytophthora nicotianae]
MDARGPPLSSVLPPHFSILPSPRVSPLAATSRSFTGVCPDPIPGSSPTIADIFLPRPVDQKLQHTSSQLRLRLQWASAFKMQILVVRNTVVCCFCAGVANGAFYVGNVFTFKSSVDQSLKEFTTAMLVWMAITYAVIMLIAHVPILMTQKFIKYPNKRPSFWFCASKLMKKSYIAFAASLSGMIAVGILVQHTRLMHEYFRFKMHFYLAVVNNLTFTAGLMFAVRRIYYEETYQGRDRRSAQSKHSSTTRSKAYRPPKYHTPSYWREYRNHLPNALTIVIAGGYVHIVLMWWQHAGEQASVMTFAVFGIVLKLILQEVARLYVLKKKIRSTRIMCLLVGTPTVLIDTQSRIILLGTQTNAVLVTGTFALAIAEVSLRAAKAAFVVWTTRRRSRALDKKLHEISHSRQKSAERVSSTATLKLEFEFWRKQVISYHTAEVTADMYAEHIAIGCSQSIVFWWLGHPLYPAMRVDAMSELDASRFRFNQVAMLGFQCLVEVFVDYVCIVMEMAVGIEFDRIEGLSTFLGALFMTMAVININISSGVYLG